jgi:hypothetical protein
MRLFAGSRNTYPAPEAIALPDSWSVIEAQYGANRLVGWLRDGASELSGHPAYRQQVGIALILNRPRQDGLPDDAESEQIYDLEDLIQDKLEADNQSLLVAKWFVRGCRELVFYTTDVKALSRRLDEIASKGTRNQMQLTSSKDPDWKVLQQFARAA